MKKKIIILMLTAIASIGTAFASTQVDSIWYNLYSSTLTAEVTYRGSSYGEYANEYSGSIVIPSHVSYNGLMYSVKSIGNEAFKGCTGLASVTIPNSVKSIGQSAFYLVPNIVYNGSATGAPWGAKSLNGYVDGWFVYSDATKTTLLACFCNASGDITIPNSVTSIGQSAFNGCTGLTSVEIPNSVTSIGRSAFENCSGLISVTIPNSVTSIGAGAFVYCNELKEVTLNSNAIVSKNYTSSLNLKNYFGSQVTRYVIGDTITSIGNYAFYGCTGLTSVTIGEGVTSIGSYAFYNCTDLTSIDIPNSVTSIGSYAFAGCSGMTSVTIPNSVTSIGERAFLRCSSLTSITIPNSVTSIGAGAFYGCTGLTSVTIGEGVTSIGKYAFEGCTSLLDITCYATVVPTIYATTFADIGNKQYVYLYVPSDRERAYKRDTYWGEFDIQIKSAASTTTDEVKVVPTETTAAVTWPAVSGAATYDLVIKDKSGNAICTLIFNAQGQLTQIAFNAPAQRDALQQTQAAGFSFVITGLEEGNEYNLAIIAKDSNGGQISAENISFTTMTPTAINQITDSKVPAATKFIRDGKIYILRDGKVYDLTGREL